MSTTTARHALHTTSPIVILFRLLKRAFTRQRPPAIPLDEFLVEEFTSDQVADMASRDRTALKGVGIAILVAAVVLIIFMLMVQYFVNSELGPMFDSLMKPLPGTPR